MRFFHASFRLRRYVLSLAAVLLITAIVPAQGAAVPAAPWSHLDRQLQQLAPGTNLLVAEFSGNSCQQIHAVNADHELAVASVFKLYVLGELARQVRSGEVRWDERITLQEDLRSMPSGDYAFVPAGQTATVLQLAEAMIWHSDNTATDHLINLLGREHVERAFAAYGHSDPDVNMPLLLTREMFLIKMWQPETWMSSYMAASNAEQLSMLKSDIAGETVNPGGGWGTWNGPTAIDGIEWFASASDLCRVAVGLWTLGAQPGMEPIREIMSGNRGGITDSVTWPRVGYKNGYEAGVVNMTFVLERSDGRMFFVSAGFNQPHGAIDQSTARASLNPIFSCLATLEKPGDCSGSS